MKAIAQTRLVAMIRSDAQRFESLKREIVQLDYFCKGTVLKRMMKCGPQTVRLSSRSRQTSRAVLRMHLQNPEPDGQPNLRLYPEVTPLYRAAIQQYRKLKSLLGRMER